MSGRTSVFGVVPILLVAACQPLPHPFDEDRPPAALLKVRDVAGVAVAPVEGEPEAVAAKLGGAVAGALLKREIPASDKSTSIGSYQLYGRVVETRGKNDSLKLTAHWRLYDAGGNSVGKPTAAVEAPKGQWQSDDAKPLAQLAELSAQALAPLLAEEGPSPVAEPQRTRVAIRAVSGAPGDGGRALAAAVSAVLKHQQVAVVGGDTKADLYVEGEVSVTPVKPKVQHVKILWRVKGANGGEIGTVGQENDVPSGTLDGPWGDLAYNIALGAGDGLMQIVARVAPGS